MSDYGIYTNATLVLDEGERDLSTVNYWGGPTFAGTHLVDAPADELIHPERLPGCSIVVSDTDGAVVLSAEITDTGMVNGFGGQTTLVCEVADAR